MPWFSSPVSFIFQGSGKPPMQPFLVFIGYWPLDCRGVKNCLSKKLPSVYRKLSKDNTLSNLRIWGKAKKKQNPNLALLRKVKQLQKNYDIVLKDFPHVQTPLKRFDFSNYHQPFTGFFFVMKSPGKISINIIPR